MAKYNYICLSETDDFTDGYIIVGSTLFEVRNLNIDESWELSGDSIKDKVKSARELAELSDDVEIVYDEDNIYSEDILHDEGRLCTAFDTPLTDDEESLIEYFSKD